MTPLTRIAVALAALAALTTFAQPARAQTCEAPRVQATDGTVCDAITVSWGGGQLGTGYRVARGTDPSGAGAVVLGTTTLKTITDPTALPGVVYYYWVQQYGGICGIGSPYSDPNAGFIGRPAKPTGLTAGDDLQCNNVHVAWNPVAGAASYDVLRATTQFPEDAVVLANTTQTSYDDATADGTLQYWYWVRARSATGCIGEPTTIGDPGSSITPMLPDLVPEPAAFGGSMYATPDMRGEYRFSYGIRNAGTAPFHLRWTWLYHDGTRDMSQIYVDCDGRVVDKYLGRFLPWEGPIRVPHFVRVRLRKRAINGDPAETLAQADVPTHCVGDNSAFNLGLPGAPQTPQYSGCLSQVEGISVGWRLIEGQGTPGHAIDLGCIGAGTYWLEQIIDPDDQIRELDETNNVLRVLITLNGLPTPNPGVCPGPMVTGTLLSPDSIYVAAGAPTDSIVGRVWISGLTEPAGAHELTMAEIGYALRAQGSTIVDPWTWAPATWLRQDGAEDVYGAAITVQNPGEYVFAYRFSVFDGPWVYADLDGSINGFTAAKYGKLRAVTTTGVDDGAAGRPLAFGVISNPARGATRFRVDLPHASEARVEVFDVMGRRVRTLVPGTLPAGSHTLEWDGRSDDGVRARAGIYLARLVTSAGAPLRVKWVLAP